MKLFRDLIQRLSSADHTEHLKLSIGEQFMRRFFDIRLEI
jgi:hypothetical protein